MKKLCRISDFLKSDNKLQPKKSKTFTKHVGGDSFDFLSLIREWEHIVGPTLGKNTVPLKINNKSLVVLTGHSAFSEQLSFMETIIRDKIIATFPKLKNAFNRIYFQADNNFFKEQKERMAKVEKKPEVTFHKYSPQYKALSQEANKLFTDVDDEDMRDMLRSIYIQSFYTK